LKLYSLFITIINKKNKEMTNAIPGKDFEFNEIQEAVFTVVQQNIERWELDKGWINNVLTPKKEAWEKAWLAYLDPSTRTPIITFTKSITRKEYEPLLEILICNLETNPNVTDKERRQMGMINPFSKRKYLPPPELCPSFIVDNTLARCLVIYHFDKDKPFEVKHRNTCGAEIKWAMLDNPPSNINDLINSDFSRRSPCILRFDESKRGQKVYICLRWKGNTKGFSPWSEIVCNVIQ
jgi:hypothetical protein